MQEPFEREPSDALPKDTQEETPTGAQLLPDEIYAEQERKEKAKKALRFAATHVGWATAVLVGAWMSIQIVVSVIAGLMGSEGAAFYNKYLLVINEATLAVGIAVAAAILLSVRRVNIHKNPISASGFLKILVMCFGAGYVGNQIGTFVLSIWNFATGNSVGDELVTLLDGMNPLIMFISVGVLAPILEELFFRKLLTDRLRVFGETLAILLPAFLFALFHMSASQMVYAFTIGVLMGYLYCRTGNYWLSVLVHAIFNTVSGVIPVLFLPRLNAFTLEMDTLMETNAAVFESMDTAALAELMMPLLEEYGLILGLYVLYALAIFVINITGVVLLIVNFRKFREGKGEHSLPAKEAAKTVFKTSGMIVCTILLTVLTVVSLFA
ncbi:MAG: CPBP family intramembrane metalloprotease [Clostridia bacterium]|nr:CPBP family intramembrane metalloprotease [Clostridia bacterium]